MIFRIDHSINQKTDSSDWHTPYAESDLSVNGRFMSRMEARDGRSGFDFTGRFTAVDPCHRLAYLLDDERAVDVTFSSLGDQTRVTEIFDAE